MPNSSAPASAVSSPIGSPATPSIRALSPNSPALAPKRHEASACALCNSLFTIFFRRHHCRKCGNSICDKDSKSVIVEKLSKAPLFATTKEIEALQRKNIPLRFCKICAEYSCNLGSPSPDFRPLQEETPSAAAAISPQSAAHRAPSPVKPNGAQRSPSRDSSPHQSAVSGSFPPPELSLPASASSSSASQSMTYSSANSSAPLSAQHCNYCGQASLNMRRKSIPNYFIPRPRIKPQDGNVNACADCFTAIIEPGLNTLIQPATAEILRQNLFNNPHEVINIIKRQPGLIRAYFHNHEKATQTSLLDYLIINLPPQGELSILALIKFLQDNQAPTTWNEINGRLFIAEAGSQATAYHLAALMLAIGKNDSPSIQQFLQPYRVQLGDRIEKCIALLSQLFPALRHL